MSSATLISDASFCPRTKAAGWAGWAKTAGKSSTMFSGVFKSSPTTAWEAEFLAIGNVLHMAIAAGIVAEGSEVLLQSDCTLALAVVLKIVPGTIESLHRDGVPIPARRKKLPPVVAAAAVAIKEMVAAHGLTIKVRHVRGHTDGGGRQWVNRQCDLAAKQAMRKFRARQHKPEAVQ